MGRAAFSDCRRLANPRLSFNKYPQTTDSDSDILRTARRRHPGGLARRVGQRDYYGRTAEQKTDPSPARPARIIPCLSSAYPESGALPALPHGQASSCGLSGLRLLPGAAGNGVGRRCPVAAAHLPQTGWRAWIPACAGMTKCQTGMMKRQIAWRNGKSPNWICCAAARPIGAYSDD